jgi:hypothetical protein
MIRSTAWRALIAVLTATCLTMAAAVPASAMLAVDDGPVKPAEPASSTATRFQTPEVTEIVRGTARPQPPVAVGDPTALPRPTTTPVGVDVLPLATSGGFALIVLLMYAGFQLRTGPGRALVRG